MVVHGRAPVSPFPIRSICKIALSWRRDSILRPSERMSCILPQDHGVLAATNNNVILNLQNYEYLGNLSILVLLLVKLLLRTK